MSWAADGQHENGLHLKKIGLIFFKFKALCLAKPAIILL